jgi:putative transposase
VLSLCPAVKSTELLRPNEVRMWWHGDGMYVKLNGEMVYLWRAIHQEGETRKSSIARTHDEDAALAFMEKALKRLISSAYLSV